MESTKVAGTESKAGVKNDTGKTRFDLVPFDALWEVAKVYTTGATKYDAWNWRRGLLYSRVVAALLRHLFKWWMGERYDQEDGQHHLSSVVWGALTLLHYDLASQRYREFDDRQTEWSEVWKNSAT